MDQKLKKIIMWISILMVLLISDQSFCSDRSQLPLTIKNRCIIYLEKVVKTKGSYIFVRKTPPQTEHQSSKDQSKDGLPLTKWGGLLTLMEEANSPSSFWNRWTKWLPNPLRSMGRWLGYPQYRVTPMMFAQNIFIDLPLKSASKGRLVSTHFTHILLLGLLTSPGVIWINNTYDQILTEVQKRNEKIVDFVMSHDFRFIDINTSLKLGEINRDQARMMTLRLQMLWKDFWNRFLSESPEEMLTQDSENVKEGHLLYIHLNGLFSQGIQKSEKEYVLLSETEKKDLLLITYNCFIRQFLIVDWVLDKKPNKAVKWPDWIGFHLEEFNTDPFILNLKRTVTENNIPKEEVILALQEYYSLLMSLEINQRLNIEVIAKASDGSEGPVTILVLQEQVRSDLLSRYYKGLI